MRRCEYDVTKQLMRNSAHTFHRRLTFVNTVMAAGFGGFSASYYQANLACIVLNSRAMRSFRQSYKIPVEKSRKEN